MNLLKRYTLPVALVGLLAACAVSPTGRQQFLVMNQRQVDAMGAQAFAEMKDSKSVDRNPAINAYVQCVARAITAELPTRQRWEVAVFRESSANAFALPGGKIGVNTGLLNVARTQNQLAAVIGHEIGHVIASHANERQSQQLAVQSGLAVVDSLLKGKTQNPQAVSQALGLGAQYGILLPYGRTQESEADVIGLDLMARAGFDPRGAVDLWRNMSQAGGGRRLEFLSTHPSHDTRIQELRARMGRAMQVYQTAQAQGKRPQCGR
jgi:predicted Zn-dependent protease